MYIDGAANDLQKCAAAGVYVKKEDKTSLEKSIQLPEMTNHEAEFAALSLGVKLCADIASNQSILSIRTDSQIVCDAVDKRYVKNEQFRPYLQEALAVLDESFAMHFIKWIPSSKNGYADALAKKALNES
nr:ribonuclease HI family protein [Texcoconibacillus texcoconensis]